MNDFGIPLKPPNHPRYLNTEFVGHTFPTKTTDDDERQREHTLRHARIHDQLASDPQYAGGIGWCAFDYNTHANFGSGDRICYHGVTDIFRELKPAGGFYKSQCEPAEEIVLEPAFHWARGDESVGFTKAAICSNCDHLKLYSRAGSLESNPWNLIAETDADREQFPISNTRPSFSICAATAQDGAICASTDSSTENKSSPNPFPAAASTPNLLSFLTTTSSALTEPTPPASSFASPTSSAPSAPTLTIPSPSRSKVRQTSSVTIPSRSSAAPEPSGFAHASNPA
jgi:hypothetical protein